MKIIEKICASVTIDVQIFFMVNAVGHDVSDGNNVRKRYYLCFQ